MMPAIHPRTLKVQGAQVAISLAITRIADEHDLTIIELLGILNEIVARWLKYALRAERHPNAPEEPADLA